MRLPSRPCSAYTNADNSTEEKICGVQWVPGPAADLELGRVTPPSLDQKNVTQNPTAGGRGIPQPLGLDASWRRGLEWRPPRRKGPWS